MPISLTTTGDLVDPCHRLYVCREVSPDGRCCNHGKFTDLDGFAAPQGRGHGYLMADLTGAAVGAPRRNSRRIHLPMTTDLATGQRYSVA